MISHAGIESEPLIRLGAFVGVFLAVALWEALVPRRKRAFERRSRWPHNVGLLIVDVAAVKLFAPGRRLPLRSPARRTAGGLSTYWRFPPWLGVVLAVILLDLAIYFQHVMFHAVPTLWRLHRVHHSDLDFDVTTGTRFHPIEFLISTAIKCAAVAAIGASAIAVLAFEVLLNAGALFNHANGRLRERLDGWLRWFVVTPDMHRVHYGPL